MNSSMIHNIAVTGISNLCQNMINQTCKTLQWHHHSSLSRFFHFPSPYSTQCTWRFPLIFLCLLPLL